MTSRVLMPRLDADRARRLRGAILQAGLQAEFSPEHLHEVLNASGTFPSTGGIPATAEDMLALRESVVRGVEALSGLNGSRYGEAFDLVVGEILFRESEGRTGEFGTFAVWDFLALVLLPDLCVLRIRQGEVRSSVEMQVSHQSRLTGSDRRHVLRRLWVRWKVLGPDLIRESFLDEDAIAGIVERSLTRDRSDLATTVARRLQDVGLTGDSARSFRRALMVALVASSGLAAVEANNEEQFESLARHALSQTERRRPGTVAAATADRSETEGVNMQAPVSSPAPVAKRRPSSFMSRLLGR